MIALLRERGRSIHTRWRQPELRVHGNTGICADWMWRQHLRPSEISSVKSNAPRKKPTPNCPCPDGESSHAKESGRSGNCGAGTRGVVPCSVVYICQRRFRPRGGECIPSNEECTIQLSVHPATHSFSTALERRSPSSFTTRPFSHNCCLRLTGTHLH